MFAIQNTSVRLLIRQKCTTRKRIFANKRKYKKTDDEQTHVTYTFSAVCNGTVSRLQLRRQWTTSGLILSQLLRQLRQFAVHLRCIHISIIVSLIRQPQHYVNNTCSDNTRVFDTEPIYTNFPKIWSTDQDEI